MAKNRLKYGILCSQRAGGEAYEQDTDGVEGVGDDEKAAGGHFGDAQQREPQLVGQRRSDDESAEERQHPLKRMAVEKFPEPRRAVFGQEVGNVVAGAVAHKGKDKII